jgi:hypothetical protein
MNTTNMRHKNLTFNISGNMVRLKLAENPLGLDVDRYELRIEGLMDDTLTLYYGSKEVMSSDTMAFSRLFDRLSRLRPEAWGNSRGVMSRGETRLMRLAILLVGISVLTCLVFLLVILFK